MNEILGSLKAQACDWSELVEQLDANGDGLIDYGEFITAAVNRTRLLNEENLRIAFNLLDKDGNGQISKDELRAAFQGAACQSGDTADDESLWNQIMAEVDQNNDELISCNEFN